MKKQSNGWHRKTFNVEDGLPAQILSASGYEKLLDGLRKLWEAGKSKAHRAVTHLLLETYWNIGGRLADEQLTQNA